MNKKIKNILKFILFILFAKSMYFWTYNDPVVWLFNIIGFNNSLIPVLFFELPLNTLIKSIIIYIVGKRFEVIQFIDKFHFIIGFFLAFLMECIILYHYKKALYSGEVVLQNLGDIVMFSIIGYGFIYTFFIYKIAKIYDKKHPKFFAKIKKLKNILIKNLPLLKQDLFWIIIYGTLLCLVYDNKRTSFQYWTFFYSGVAFFTITFGYEIYMLIKKSIVNEKQKT